MKADVLLYIVTGLGLLGGIGLAIKAILERKTLSARANSDQATATAVVSAAARELIEPLRRELAAERKEHSEELESERQKVDKIQEDLNSVCAELESVRQELQSLRDELAMARSVVERLRDENVSYKRRIQRYENGL